MFEQGTLINLYRHASGTCASKGFSSSGGFYTKSFGVGPGLSKFPGKMAGGFSGKTYLVGEVSHLDFYNNHNDLFSSYWKLRTLFNK